MKAAKHEFYTQTDVFLSDHTKDTRTTVMESCSTRMIRGIHQFTLEKYSSCNGIGQGGSFKSNCFNVGGHQWAITVFPDGTSKDKTYIKYVEGHVYFDLYITLMSESSDGVPIRATLKLLDQSGKGNHRVRSSTTTWVMATRKNRGFLCFIDRDELEKSSYLKDDCLKIECVVSVMLPSETKRMSSLIALSECDEKDEDDDVVVDLLAMLKSGEGSDVVLNVKGEKFRAHKVILSARSSVFARLLASDRQELVIKNIEPSVIKALLHFIYSDALPKDVKSLVDGYAFGPLVSGSFCAKLLAAADKYDVKRLKSICESHLWRSISLSRFAEILLLAGKYNASELKHLCFKYAVDRCGVLVEMGSFCYLEKKFPLLFSELNDYISKEGSLLHTNEIEEICY